MTNVDALVAVNAANFVNAFHAANQKPLQMEFQSNSHVQVDIQSVVMSYKRTSRGAAGNRVQSRTFNFRKSFFVKRLTQRLEDRAAAQETFHGALAVDEVNVSLTLAQFRIRHAVELLRRRGEALRQERNLGSENRQFASAGFDKFAFNADDVAQVKTLGNGEILFPDLGFANHDLDASGFVLNVKPNDFSGRSHQNNASCRVDLRSVMFRRLTLYLRGDFDNFRFSSADFCNRHRAVVALTPWVNAQLFQTPHLFSSSRFQRRGSSYCFLSHDCVKGCVLL